MLIWLPAGYADVLCEIDTSKVTSDKSENVSTLANDPMDEVNNARDDFSCDNKNVKFEAADITANNSTKDCKDHK